MNKQAVALAVDSATTVTQWINDQQEKRYFKGTNKIFQLSNNHPVGLMIYGAASIQGVPWDVVVKDFRNSLGRQSFNDLDGYARELFSFIKGHAQLFPSEFQKATFLVDAIRAASIHLFLEAQEADIIKQAKSEADLKNAYHEFFAREIQKLDAEKLSDHFQGSDLEEALASHKKALEERLQELLKNSKLEEHVDAEQLSEIAIKLLFKHYPQYMDATGIVLAGYGNNDYFPCYREYRCCGVLLGKILSDDIDSKRVDRETPAVIKPFATTAMVNTFMLGFSPDVYDRVWQETMRTLRSFAESLKADTGAELSNLDDRINQFLETHTASWTRAAMENHAWPLQRVIGSLPVDEMAELAETLIMLESLKEKVTQPTQSVGGPIDVCIISKGDGFVWIKRKHYFDPQLNPRFFSRQRAEHE
jgi:hypothetical protein